MAHWLMKSEPDAFSWQQQMENGIEPWTGVRSHQAKRNLEAMRCGDRAFFYHSNSGREIVGIVEIVREAYPDPSAGDGNWICVDVRAIAPLSRPVTLAEIKAAPEFADLALVRQSRLSVVPVSKAHWNRICALGGWTE
jgi:predicted RNA-binding protein with PUA-like domain